ncbi:hypothetical protein V502_10138 [Pseudogymnoascus sp. VKM F-4520 (FW-2644)]|nr:hypothetical protein V502_10138 [Pseudogymnoascus sp. VKM F-4520 (FW-2644)]
MMPTAKATAETPTPATLPIRTTSKSRPTDATPLAPAAKKSRLSPPTTTTTTTTTTSTTSRLALAGLILAFSKSTDRRWEQLSDLKSSTGDCFWPGDSWPGGS